MDFSSWNDNDHKLFLVLAVLLGRMIRIESLFLLVSAWMVAGLAKAEKEDAVDPRRFDEILGPINRAPFCDLSEDAFRFTGRGVEIPRRCFVAPNGQPRCYYVYVPSCASESGVPLVYDVTPYGLCPSTYALYSGWAQKASEECFVVVWPIGNTRPDDADFICWELPGGVVGLDPKDPAKETSDCCCAGPTGGASSVTFEDTQDLAFLRAIGTDLAATNVPIDPKRIYVTGHSNGCYAASAMAMQASDYVAAIACMSALWVTPPAADYSATPLWILMGEQDAAEPYEGTDVDGIFRPSFEVSFEALANINGCLGRSTEEEAILDMDVDSLLLQKNGTMRIDTGTDCQNNATVTFVTLTTAGHTPFLRAPEILPPSFRAAKTTIDTTGMAWDFLSAYSLEQPPPEFQ